MHIKNKQQVFDKVRIARSLKLLNLTIEKKIIYYIIKFVYHAIYGCPGVETSLYTT